MQLITFISVAAATVATVSARSAIDLNKECDKSQAYARVINRCDYPVYLWSVFRGDGCPSTDMITLQKGETYSENYQDPEHGIGVSIKMSKEKQCKGNDIVQLEYFLEKSDPAFAYNYLDVSYVDCLGNDCPTKKEGYYLQSGSQTGKFAASAANTWCPILACSDAASCAKMSYILPDDVQTKTCDLKQNMDFYMCGGEAPTSDYSSPPASSAPAKSAPVKSAPVPASSSKKVESPKPSTTLNKVVSSIAAYKANAAVVTSAPQVKEPPKVKTTVVYVTAVEYVNAKRREHAHARRHQPFHA